MCEEWTLLKYESAYGDGCHKLFDRIILTYEWPVPVFGRDGGIDEFVINSAYETAKDPIETDMIRMPRNSNSARTSHISKRRRKIFLSQSIAHTLSNLNPPTETPLNENLELRNLIVDRETSLNRLKTI